MAKLILPSGHLCLIDDADEARIRELSWHAYRARCVNEKHYVRHTFYDAERRVHALLLHRFILNAGDGELVDHINNNGLDNRRANLRLASRSQNNTNRITPGSRFGYRGVRENRGRFIGRVRFNGRQYGTSRFETPEEAARARDVLALKVQGEFAVLNFPEAAR